MFGDHKPVMNPNCERVLVIEESDFISHSTDEIIEKAFSVDAVNYVGEDQIFWIVFAQEPRRLWDFTEKSLRSTINTKKAELANKEVAS